MLGFASINLKVVFFLMSLRHSLVTSQIFSQSWEQEMHAYEISQSLMIQHC